LAILIISYLSVFEANIVKYIDHNGYDRSYVKCRRGSIRQGYQI